MKLLLSLAALAGCVHQHDTLAVHDSEVATANKLSVITVSLATALWQ